MTDKELLARISSADPDAEYRQELQGQLTAELNKPVSEQDFDLIEDLTEAIAALDGTEQFIDKRTELGISRVKQNIQYQTRRKRTVLRKWIAVCACIVLIGSNVFSYTAYGMNAFSAAYQLFKGGFVIDFSKQKNISVADHNPYAEDMRKICSEHDIDALLPTKMPEGFSPANNYGEYTDLDVLSMLSFYFQSGSKKLIIRYSKIKSDETDISLGVSSDHHNISEQIINGTVITISKEDGQYTAAFMIDEIQYTFYADGIDYDNCQIILHSMFE